VAANITTPARSSVNVQNGSIATQERDANTATANAPTTNDANAVPRLHRVPDDIRPSCRHNTAMFAPSRINP
ncbi:hypothetical protein KCV01_g24915, partial [Aureobasidium melanogenum]